MAKGPFTKAIEGFDPSAEPFANMTPDRLEEVKRQRLHAKDIAGFWQADTHAAERMTLLDRYTHYFGSSTVAYLLVHEDRGLMPKGWTMRNMVAVWAVVYRDVASRMTAETCPYTSSEECRTEADDHGVLLAHAISNKPGPTERIQEDMERQNGGPFVPPSQ